MAILEGWRRGCSWITSVSAVALLASSAQAAFVEFQNCLAENVINSNPKVLQIVPLNATVFLSANSTKNLTVTIYGNITGSLYAGALPSANDTEYWTNPNETNGKLQDVVDGAPLATTLFASFNVLSYTPYTANPSRFCDELTQGECPLAPSFDTNSSDLDRLSAYSFSHELYSSYAFTTIEATTRVQSGQNKEYYGCVRAFITPDIGSMLNGLLRYAPMAVLIVVGIATVAAATLSPWGSVDIFHWSSNFGRDPDVLRLVTPGFGDCLQYIQFIVFTGSLSLSYPGFYQPVVSRVSWSSLMFNESLVSGGNGTSPVTDGIYQYRQGTTQGMDRMTQLIGMSSPRDAWAAMMVWLVVIVACSIVLTQIGFGFRFLYRLVKDVPAEDLRSKNWYFSVGNVVRISMVFFILPLFTLSLYQFVIASLGPAAAVAVAAVVLVAIVAFCCWLVFLFSRTRPRSFLFDDLQTVLAYGPLYNTYRDDAMTFALVPILVNCVRGIAIGAVQASGTAQIVLLAICEVAMILTLNAQRPYPAATSMNLYHTCFASIRLLTIMLSLAFIPSLNVSETSRGWIGYAILLIHACVLVFGFFLNAIQTLIEVIARLAGAGATGHNDAARGGLVKVFGMRQLSRRVPRRDVTQRNSMGSNAQMLVNTENEKNLALARTRTRSMSAGSSMLLDANGGRREHRTSQMDGRVTPEGMAGHSKASKAAGTGAIIGMQKQVDLRDPYYRPPRRNTMDMMTNPLKLTSSTDKRDSAVEDEAAIDDGGEGSSSSPNKGDKDELEDGAELTKTKTDYAVREVDFYYGVRGPALSSGTRKLKTGPADPTGPVSSARGWIRGIMGGKTKEKGKGFEVVRSARAPPGMIPETPEAPGSAANTETTFRDVPLDDRRVSHEEPRSPSFERSRSVDNRYEAVSSEDEEEPVRPASKMSREPPSLPLLDSFGAIELPSRIGSEASRRHKRPIESEVPEVPALPRRSSRRDSDPSRVPDKNGPQIPPKAAEGSSKPQPLGINTSSLSATPSRLPFSRGSSKREQNRLSTANSEASSHVHGEAHEEQENQVPLDRPTSVGYVNQHRTSDNIRYSPDEAQIPYGSTAEYGYSGQGYHNDPTWSPAWNGSSAVDGQRRFSRFRD